MWLNDLTKSEKLLEKNKRTGKLDIEYYTSF